MRWKILTCAVLSLPILVACGGASPSSDSKLGATGGVNLTVNVYGGVDDIWPDHLKYNVTYCVSRTFGANYDNIVRAVREATDDWASSAGFNYTHVPAEDGNCNENNTAVTFDVRPVSGQNYLMAAFYPSYARRNRSLVVDSSALAKPYSEYLGYMRHEIGHTLGFRHEHILVTGGCSESGTWAPLTEYDSASVMHYPHCKGGTGNMRNLVLTDFDRQGAQSVYPLAAGNIKGSLYVTQNNRLHCVNAKTRQGSWSLVGSSNWANASSATILGNNLYVIQANRLHRVNRLNGTWNVLGTSDWGGPTSMAALGDWLYIVQNGRLHRVNPNDGSFQLLGATSWAGTTSMSVVGNSLYIIQNNRLHRVDQNGGWAVLGSGLWNGPTLMTSLNGSLYIVQNNSLHRVDPNSGNYQVLGGASWAGATSMAATDGDLYIIQNNRLHRVNAGSGTWTVLGTTDWSGPTTMAGFEGSCLK